MPDDQGYTWQWGLWSTMGIQAEDAWDITPGSDSVRVGIIDTGISPHPDLNGNLVAGWNFVDDNNNTADTEGHGTKVAGVVGAVGNNSVGMTGVCWNVSLVPLKIENGGYATLGLADRIISALIYAEDNDISIVNLSWGGLGYNVAMSYAIISYDGLFICAAGNDSVDIDATPTYPACHFNTVSVGSIGPTGDLSDISNWGAHYVDLFAPGDSIFTTTLGSQYGHYRGTSLAAPYVAGVAALVKSIRPAMSRFDIMDVILENVDVVPALQGLCVTGGRLNAYKVLSAIVGDEPLASPEIRLNGYLIGNIIVDPDGTHEVVQAENAGTLVKPYHPEYDPVLNPLQNYMTFGSVPWRLSNYLAQNNTSIVIPCGLSFPVMLSSGRSYISLELDITVTSNQVSVGNDANMEILWNNAYTYSPVEIWER